MYSEDEKHKRLVESKTVEECEANSMPEEIKVFLDHFWTYAEEPAGAKYIHKEKDRAQLIQWLEGEKETDKLANTRLQCKYTTGHNAAIDSVIAHLRSQDATKEE